VKKVIKVEDYIVNESSLVGKEKKNTPDWGELGIHLYHITISYLSILQQLRPRDIYPISEIVEITLGAITSWKSFLVSAFCGFGPRASGGYSPSQMRLVRPLLLHPRYMHGGTICKGI
jgi:hypothetical protein